MTGNHEVRTLRRDEIRAAVDVFRGSLHRPPISDANWAEMASSFEPERVLGALDDTGVIGTAWSFHTETLVPGGARVPTMAVSRVGVRADRTRRGVLTGLMRAQLDAAAGAGESLASLRASEAVIYDRFGYGVATRGCARTIDRRTARLRTADGPASELRLLDREAAFTELPGVYERIGLLRPGMIDRPAQWWHHIRTMAMREEAHMLGVVHGARGREDGFARYEIEKTDRNVLQVHDLFAANDEAYRDLVRFLLGVDLISEVRLPLSPLDDPVELLLADRRACRVTDVEDETWLRLVDVPSALAAREYGDADPVRIGVRDPLRPANSGTYRVGTHGAEPADTEPELECHVDTLGAMYLGDVTASTLATAGLLRVAEPKALPRADVLFTSTVSPWCGTFF